MCAACHGLAHDLQRQPGAFLKLDGAVIDKELKLPLKGCNSLGKRGRRSRRPRFGSGQHLVIPPADFAVALAAVHTRRNWAAPGQVVAASVGVDIPSASRELVILALTQKV